MTDLATTWVLAPVHCPWCRRAAQHWHSVRGFGAHGEPKIGLVVSETDPAEFGEDVVDLPPAQEG